MYFLEDTALEDVADDIKVEDEKKVDRTVDKKPLFNKDRTVLW